MLEASTKTSSRQTDIKGRDRKQTNKRESKPMKGKKVPRDRKREGWKYPIIQAFPKDLPVCWDVGSNLEHHTASLSSPMLADSGGFQ